MRDVARAVIRARSLTKSYGSTLGIDRLDFTVSAGETLGLLGPSGTGKTTTIRLLLDLIRPDSGAVDVFSLAPRAAPDVRRRTATCPATCVSTSG